MRVASCHHRGPCRRADFLDVVLLERDALVAERVDRWGVDVGPRERAVVEAVADETRASSVSH